MSSLELPDEDRRLLTGLEEALWRESTRFDAAFMEQALAADCFEIGRSGRTYTRQQILDCPREAIDAQLPLPDLQIKLLDLNTALVTYTSKVRCGGILQVGRRSSIWIRCEGRWRLRFHQGTPQPAQDDEPERGRGDATAVRAQYHLRRTGSGIDAFDVRRLIDLSKNLPVKMISPHGLPELDIDHWYFHTGLTATPRSLLCHMKLVNAADIRYPIILDEDGRVMDGMHRVCRAILDGVVEIPAVRFEVDPEPDFVNCDPDRLPYD